MKNLFSLFLIFLSYTSVDEVSHRWSFMLPRKQQKIFKQYTCTSGRWEKNVTELCLFGGMHQLTHLPIKEKRTKEKKNNHEKKPY